MNILNDTRINKRSRRVCRIKPEDFKCLLFVNSPLPIPPAALVVADGHTSLFLLSAGYSRGP